MIANRGELEGDAREATRYQIRFKAFTVLTGSVEDQAALYGLLKKARDLGMPLLSLFCVENDAEMPHRASHDGS